MKSFTPRILILIILLHLGLKSKGHQSIVLGNFRTAFQTAFNPKQGIEAIFTKDTLKIIDLESFRILSATPIQIPSEIYLMSFDPYYINDMLYISNRDGGQTYRWENNNFKRLDESFTHKMQLGAPGFTFENRYYRYGGYGYWSFRNFFTCFDETSKGWDVLPAEASTSFPAGSGDGTYVKIIGDDWYVFGGEVIKQSNPKEFEQNQNLWVFHTKTKKWELLGLTNSKLIQKIVASIHVENKLLLLSRNYCYEVDLQKNVVSTHKLNASPNFYCPEGPNLNFHYYYKGFYYLVTLNNSTLDAKLTKEKSLYEDQIIETSQAYATSNLYIYLLIIVIGSLITLVILGNRRGKRKVKNKIHLSGHRLSYNNHSIELEEECVKMLELFLTENELSTNQILDFLKKEHLHYTQNLRILHQMINELNLKFRLLIDRKIDLITEKKSSVDKRSKSYFINKSYFEWPQIN